MARVKKLTNSLIGENTYIVYDNSGACAIIDPGMYTAFDQNQLSHFIANNDLKPALLLNTHCHYDHIFGNKFVFDNYGLKPQFHRGELELLQEAPAWTQQMGLFYELSPLPDTFLPEEGTITFGQTTLELIFAPGHSPAHLCFYCRKDNFLIGGDVLFRGSIGRTDFPGGSHELLIRNIREKLFVLPDDCTVYPGHGPETTIGYEKRMNPFLAA